MKRLSTILLLVHFSIAAYNQQVVKGVILDGNTKDKIGLASVYFNGSFAGTTSNSEGYFELNISKYNSIPIVVSAIGYYSKVINNYSTNKLLTISLEPKQYSLEEVFIKAKSSKWKRKINLSIFKDQFLGTTINALNCKIVNEDDILFKSNSDTIKAFAKKPILIVNEALGYKIFYYLDKFEYYKKDSSFLFNGNMIFTEDMINNQTQRNNYEKRRRDAYLGSRMHLFRSLWANNLNFEGFDLRYSEKEFFNYDKNVINDLENKRFLKLPSNLLVTYHYNNSRIISRKETIYFDKNGYYDGLAIFWEGEMAKQRIADMLPLEYSIK